MSSRTGAQTCASCRHRVLTSSVLHDGAPNVGTAWLQDAFTQAELVLASLRLATEFLAPGGKSVPRSVLTFAGSFVTKVFRSKDYNNLMWVFNQLFTKVEATKPPASRNVSAEIFVVCMGFLAPKRIDPKLLSAKHVFKDLEAVATAEQAANSMQSLNVFQPQKKRRKREGYAEGDTTLFHSISAAQFVESSDPIGLLSSSSRIEFNAEADAEHVHFVFYC